MHRSTCHPFMHCVSKYIDRKKHLCQPKACMHQGSKRSVLFLVFYDVCGGLAHTCQGLCMWRPHRAAQHESSDDVEAALCRALQGLRNEMLVWSKDELLWQQTWDTLLSQVEGL
eukprot:896519-Pelagomonas_calceolata.AAC.5